MPPFLRRLRGVADEMTILMAPLGAAFAAATMAIAKRSARREEGVR